MKCGQTLVCPSALNTIKLRALPRQKIVAWVCASALDTKTSLVIPVLAKNRRES